MANNDDWRIKENPEIIGMLKPKVERISDTRYHETETEIHFNVNWNFNDSIDEMLKSISKQYPTEIIKFSFAPESNWHSEIDNYEILNGKIVFTGKTLNYMIDFDEVTLPEPVQDVITKLKTLDTIQGRKITYFPQTKVKLICNGETFKIHKNKYQLYISARDESGKKTNKYQHKPDSFITTENTDELPDDDLIF